jgi:hypothetical protein
MTKKTPNIGPRLGDMRVLTLNLNQRFGKWTDRRSVLIDGTRSLQPDLVAFHESITPSLLSIL